MPIGPKHTLGGSSPTATRQFTDREGFIETFEDALANLDPETYRVVTYYGMGGIGKSCLRKKLQSVLDERDTPVTWATLNFETVQHRTVDDALYWMRSELRRKEGVRFLSFDLAYAVHWQKTHPQSEMREDEVPFLSEGSLITELVGVAEDLPFVQIVAKLPGLIQKTSTSVQEWWRRRGQEALREIRDMEPAEIADWLPAFWARDLQDHIESSGLRLVLFIDTYEALWEGRRTESRFFTADDWVREWVAHLPEVLWVITGRERLRWDEMDDDWNDVLDQHLMGELSDADARRFLESCGIRDDAIQNTIIAGGEGVPFFLDLAVDTYEKIEQAEDRHPEPADFAGTPREVLDRFLHYLSTEERETLKVLAVARQWDRELFAALIEHFQTGYPATALAQLCRFSFVQEMDAPDTWTLHALMRESLQEHQDDALCAEVHQFLFDHYADPLQDLGPKELRDAHQLALREAFHHGQHVLNADNFQDWFEESYDPFYEAERWGFLVPIQEKFVAFVEHRYGPDHSDFGEALGDLALFLANQGHYQKAELLYQRTLDVKRNSIGENHPIYADTLSNLASLHMTQGRYDEAEPLLRESVEIGNNTLEADDPKVAPSLNNLALLYEKQGRYTKAEPLLQQVLEISKKAFGEEHHKFAHALNNLAFLYNSQARYDEAESLYRRALEISEASLGRNHSEVAGALSNLAGLHKTQGRYGKAELLYQRALSIEKKVFGEEHPEVASTLNNFATLVLHTDQDFANAESLLQRALKITKNAFGEKHPRFAASLENLASLRQKQYRFEEAKALYQRSLEITELFFGKDHSETASGLYNLARLHLSRNRQDEAEPLLRRALAIREEVLGGYHPDVALTHLQLARLHERRGDWVEAELLYRLALEIQEVTLTVNHLSVGHTLHDLAFLYKKQERYDDAKPLYLRALNIKEQALGENHPEVAITLNNLAALYESQDLWEEAEPLYQRALEVTEEAHGEDHSDTIAVREQLAALQEMRDDVDSA